MLLASIPALGMFGGGEDWIFLKSVHIDL